MPLPKDGGGIVIDIDCADGGPSNGDAIGCGPCPFVSGACVLFHCGPVDCIVTVAGGGGKGDVEDGRRLIETDEGWSVEVEVEVVSGANEAKSIAPPLNANDGGGITLEVAVVVDDGGFETKEETEAEVDGDADGPALGTIGVDIDAEVVLATEEATDALDIEGARVDSIVLGRIGVIAPLSCCGDGETEGEGRWEIGNGACCNCCVVGAD